MLGVGDGEFADYVAGATVLVTGAGGSIGAELCRRLTQPHMSGSKIRRIQRRLVALGFGPIDVDGVFGPQTDAAVRRLQQTRGLTVDGIVGPQTQSALG